MSASGVAVIRYKCATYNSSVVLDHKNLSRDRILQPVVVGAIKLYLQNARWLDFLTEVSRSDQRHRNAD